ncbi:Kinesin light chain 3 [Phlyctochytrium bullatum]|nr:Kinesin light chain 3 [Phlyctochytrium bullatum]
MGCGASKSAEYEGVSVAGAQKQDELEAGQVLRDLEPESEEDEPTPIDANPEEKVDETSFSLLGIRLSYFQKFIDQCGGKEQLEGLTTTQVNIKYLQPATAASKLSMCEQLLLDPEQKHYVGTAVEAINIFCQSVVLNEEHVEDPILWFDLFSNSQHDTAVKPFGWWKGTFLNAVGKIGKVVMVMMPWDAPIPLTRAWCVFELYATSATQSRFEVAMSRAESDRFLAVIRDDPKAFFKVLAKVRSRASIAFKLEDQKRIHKTIRQSVGFTDLDSQMFRVFERWMLRTLEDKRVKSRLAGDNLDEISWMVALAKLNDLQGRYGEAEPLLAQSVERRKEILGDNHPDTIAAIYEHGMVLCAAGSYANSEPLLRKSLEARESLFGKADLLRLQSLAGLAALMEQMGRSSEAEALYQECLSLRQEILGRNHLDTVDTMNALAFVFEHQAQYEKAGELFEQCLTLRQELLGGDHPEVLIAMNNLASNRRARSNLADAEKIYLDCLKRSRRTLGDNHPFTLTISQNLSETMAALGKLDAAVSLYQDSLSRRRKVAGPRHPATILTAQNLAAVLKDTGKREEAQTLLDVCIEDSQQGLGEDHPLTLLCLSTKAALLEDKGDQAEAKKLHEDILERRRRVLGADHHQTLLTQWSLANVRLVLNVGEAGELLPLYADCYEKALKALGEGHVDTLRFLSSLATCKELVGDKAGAEVLYRSAVEERRKAFGNANVETHTEIINLARVCRVLGKLEEAHDLIQQILHHLEFSLEDYKRHQEELQQGPDRGARKKGKPEIQPASKPKYQNSAILRSGLRELAQIYEALGKEDTWFLYSVALNFYIEALGPAHPEVTPLLLKIGERKKPEPDKPNRRK